MSATIEIDQLRVGMFIHLDLGWWAHPFALSSFAIASPDQIETLRGLGLKKLRWSPEKSQLATDAQGADAGAATPADGVAHEAPEAPARGHGEAAPDQRHAELRAQLEATVVCEKQYREAGQAWKIAMDQLDTEPQLTRDTTEALTRSLLSKMMIDGEMCIRVLAEGLSDRAGAHALNVAVLSLLMGRVFGLTEPEMMDMGVGALLHDVGKVDVPDRLRWLDSSFNQAEQAKYREHVVLGLAQGKRMGLGPGPLTVLAQHHEMADGSGFPQRLNIDRMGAAARIVSLVNRYDNLCNPPTLAQSLTPHEALSLIFAQARSKFDTSMLNAFIRMMGVYPPGSLVQLTDDRYATVVSVNSSRPLKPRVLVADLKVPPEEALLLNLETQADLGIRRSLKASQLPSAIHTYLSPTPRMVYFFESTRAMADVGAMEIGAA